MVLSGHMWTLGQHTDTETGAVTWQVRLTDQPDQIVAGGMTSRDQAMAHVGELLTGALVAAPGDAPQGRQFRATYREGVETRDGGGFSRVIDVGASNFDRATPIPLMATDETTWGHDGAVLVGAVTSCARDGADLVVLEGRFDVSDRAVEFARLVDDGLLTRHSPDLGADTTEFECTEYDEDWGWCDAGVLHFTDATVLGTTIVPFPALDDAMIEIVGDAADGEGTDGGGAEAGGDAAEAVAAAGAGDVLLGQDLPGHLMGGFVASATATEPVRSVTLTLDRPQAPFSPEWFRDPLLPGPTPLTVLPDGRVIGHLATWFDAEGAPNCHIGIPDHCVTPPRSQTGYAYAHTGGPIELSNGEKIRVGHLTVGTGHAPTSGISAEAAAAHYDNTGYSAALVRYGEDEHGIWVAGVVNPVADDFQIWALEVASLSGDWRRRKGNLELVAALAVNVPGFPIEDVVTASAAGECTALVAAGARYLAKLKSQRPVPMPGEALMPMFHAGLSAEQIRTSFAEYRQATDRRLAHLEGQVTVLAPFVEEQRLRALDERVAAIRPPVLVQRRHVRLDRSPITQQ